MKLHSNIDAFFIENKTTKDNKSNSLEIGKTYKATIISNRGNTLYFSINGIIFKTNLIDTSSKYLFLKVLDNGEKYKFELIRENIVIEKNRDIEKNLVNLLKEKYSESLFEQIEKDFLNIISSQKNEIFENIYQNLKNSNFFYLEQKYHGLYKIDEDKYFHIEFYEVEPSCFSFNLNFELENEKILLVKGYFKKEISRVNCNFITNSMDFYKRLANSEEELLKINKKFEWICKQKFDEFISI